MSDGRQNTKWIVPINMPTNDNPPCETVLMATNEHFAEFAARVAAVNPYFGSALDWKFCLFCEKTQAINAHEDDCVWIEAKRIADEQST